MAGPRRAQYVSIPLGPGVLSNTTGRGARTRINYMNWDRWKDATWVRWHKLLPEKQGGWQYEALSAANQAIALVPGSPIMLLHLNEVVAPFNSSLLLHMDGANNSTSFPDASVDAQVVTANGGTVVDTTNPKWGTGSASFPSNGSTLTMPLNTSLDLEHGQQTIEGWFRIAASPPAGLNIIFSDWTTFPTGNFVRLYINGNAFSGTGTSLSLQVSGYASVTAAGPSSVAINDAAWHYFAAELDPVSGKMQVWVDGIAGTAQTGYVNNPGANGNTLLQLGGDGSSSVQGNWFRGHLDEIRITNTLLYPLNANFTPPVGPLSASPALPSPGAIIDSSLNNLALTATGAAALSTNNSEFGNASLLVGTSTTSCINTPITLSSPLDFTHATAWTVEFWINPADAIGLTQTLMSMGQRVSGSFDSGFQITSTGNAVGGAGGSGCTIIANITGATSGPSSGLIPVTPQTGVKGLVAGQWNHIALVRNGNTYQIFLNGLGGGFSTAFTGPYTQWDGFFVAPGYFQASSGFVGGAAVVGGSPVYIDEVRVTGVALYTTNFTPPLAENTFGLPNTLGTATPPSGIIPPIYLGLARDLHDWSSIDGQYWIAIGTHLKLYVVNQATLYDITPDRKTSNLTNPLTTTSASALVTIVDNNHQAATGDFVDITGASAVGGITLSGDYEISVIDPNTYTVLAASNAASGATGGGHLSIAYEISAGLPANGQLLGYGTGPYGEGTYGTPRPAGTGVFARMRTWSLDNYGQDLIASQSDGEIYWWQRNSGPNSPAAIIPLAPTGCQRVIVDAQQRVIVALGCTDVTSAFDAMLVRWCSFNDITDWVPTDVNTAGDELLTAGSRIVTGLKTKGQNLIFTDTTLYRMVFVGGEDIYDFYPAGDVTVVGPNAAVDVDGVAYLMGFDNFYNYSGTLNLQACDVWETVFDPNVSTSLNRAQSEGVTCYTYEPKTEITWLYQSIGGAFAVALTGGLSQESTSATLSVPWTGNTGFYDLQFSDQESRPVLLTNGQTTATWILPLVGAVGASATFIGNDRYVTFNWEDGTFYYGQWFRTCAQGRAPAMAGYPYGVNGGYLYQHEVGTDAIEAYGTQAIGFYMKSLDITVGGAKSEYTMGGSDARFAVGGSDAHLLIRSILPDWVYMTGAMNLTLFTKDRPQQQSYVQDGPVAFSETTGQIDIDAHGSQIVIQLDNFTGAAGAPSLGSSFRMGIFQGLATPYAKR